MFWCTECASLRDSDDGREEVGRRLVCVDCANEVAPTNSDIFPVRREGWRWRVCEVGSDGIERPIPSALFWRWISAGRLSMELLRIYHSAVHEGQNG